MTEPPPAPSGEPDDAELVVQARVAEERRRREEAFRALLRRYWRTVVVLVEARLPSSRDAEDVAQEAFIRAWRGLGNLQDPRLFLGWLLRIARNLATDVTRRKQRESSIEALRPEVLETAHPRTPEAASAEESVARREEWASVAEALRELPERYRTIIVLRYLQGLSNQEIARRLGLPEGTVRNRLFRAIRKLRKALESEEAKHP